MSGSENESDFASAESDGEDVEPTKELSNPQSKAEDSQPSQETVAEPSTETVTVSPQDLTQETKEQSQGETTADKEPENKEADTDTVPPIQKEPTAITNEPQGVQDQEVAQKPKSDKPSESAAASKDSGGGWGWGWGSIWSSVSTVTESAQALGSKVSSVIASVEEGLGLPSPSELAQNKEAEEEERRLAEAAVEHDSVELTPVLEEPHHVPDIDHHPQRTDSDHPEQTDSDHPEPTDSDHPEQTGDKPSDSGYGGFLTGLASVVQSTSKGLVSGGLDALETLGKKTMKVLSEGDPGLQKKRAMLAGQTSPTLTQLLEEVKSRPQSGGDGGAEEGPLNYSRLFDEYHGVVHLEALELLSKECATKVIGGSPSMGDEDAERLREKMEELEACFVVEEDEEVLDDDSSKLPEVLELFTGSKLPLKVDKLIKVSNGWRDKVEQTTPTDENKAQATPTDDDATPTSEENTQQEEPKDLKPISETLYANGLSSLAELTSASIELFKKTAELTLLPNADKSDPIEQAKKLNRLTVLVCSELDCLASVHSEAITQLDLPDTNSSVTSLYLEASNSSTYVQDAFQLLLPILKLIQIQHLSAEVPEPSVLSRT